MDGYAGSWANCFWWGGRVDALLRVDGYAGSWAKCFWWGGGLMRYKEWMDMLGVGLIVFGGGGVDAL